MFEYNKNNPLRVGTLFSGYDSQCLALERLKKDFPDFDYELVAWCEIEPSAITAHNALFPQWADRNLGDITKINPEDVPDCDCMTWSFPCTDISNAGKQAGLSNDSGTRSSLCWDAMRIFKAKKPKYLLMENVKALVSQKFMPDFKQLMDELADMGYSNFWQIMNAKDYGVAQNRERVFMVSILDSDRMFHFPKKMKLEKRLKDVLEENVDEKYYLKEEQVQRIVDHCDRKVAEGCGFKTSFTDGGGYSNSITANYGQRETDLISKKGRLNSSQDGIVFGTDGIAPTHTAGHGNVPKIIDNE